MRLLSFALGCALLLACQSDSSSKRLSTQDAAKALENRNWMDLWPTGDREGLHVYRLTPSMGGGVYQDRTLYAGDFELFTYEIGNGVLEIDWPHTKQRESIPFRIERVDGPEPFDLKLTFENNLRGPPVFYGRSSETSATLFLP